MAALRQSYLLLLYDVRLQRVIIGCLASNAMTSSAPEGKALPMDPVSMQMAT